MKRKDAVRSPELINSGSNNTSDSENSVGAVLRRAKRDLILSRIVYGILFLLVIALLFLAYSFGYIGDAIEKFYALMG